MPDNIFEVDASGALRLGLPAGTRVVIGGINPVPDPEPPVVIVVPPPVSNTPVDLAVSAVTMSPAAPKAGEEVTFSATVYNKGGTATPNGVIVGVPFKVDGTLVAWSDNNSTSLAGGAQRVQTSNGGPSGKGTWTATGGTHTIIAAVDDVARIEEADEGNNEGPPITFTVAEASGGGVITPPVNPTTSTAQRQLIIPPADQYAADWTDDVLDSQSITLHANYADEASVTNVIAPALRDLRVRYWRDGFANEAKSIRKVRSLVSITGARGCVTVDTRDGNNPGNVVAYLKAMGGNAAIWAAEGLNEWDIHRDLRDDQGQGWPNPNYNNRLYNSVVAARSSDSTVAGILVGTPTQATPENTPAMGTVSSDVLMHHPYQGGALPMDQMESRWLPKADAMDANRHTKPIFSSETGYHLVNEMAGQPGITVTGARKYIPRLFFGYRRLSRIRQRWIGASLYNLSTDNWSCLLTNSGSRTVAFTALASMNQLLADPGTRPATRTLPGTINTNGVSDVQWHVMQKRDGSFWIALWREVKSVNQNTNAATRTDVNVARVPVAVNLSVARTGVVYRPNTAGTAAQESTGSGNTHTVQVGDEITLLRLGA